MNIYWFRDMTLKQIKTLKYRSTREIMNQEIFDAVRTIAEDVRRKGDKAVIEATKKHDCVNLTEEQLRVTDQEIEEAWESMSEELIRSLEQSINNHLFYNQKFVPSAFEMHELSKGIHVGRKSCPLENVALYVPSGKGSYPSTFITIAVPAIVAGVKNIHVVVPPKDDGTIDPAILAVAKLLGINNIYRSNGVAGIAAVTYGTSTFPRVDKIVGPGGPYIMAAQMLAQLQGTSVALLFGPSECMIIADDIADPELVAADLINEAEHGVESSAILITDSLKLAEDVAFFVQEQIQDLPDWRRDYAKEALKKYGGIIIVDNMDQAIELANDWGNEHIQVVTSNQWDVAKRITSASELLVGQSTTFSAISYAIGVPACLPTGQFSRTYSGVTVDTFIRYSAVCELQPEGLQQLSDSIYTLADYEGFPAHRNSIEIRKNKGIIN